VLATDPRNVVALNNLAFLSSLKDARSEDALAMIDAAIKEAGPHPELLDTRGVVLTRAGRPDEAVADLQQVIATASSPVAMYHLAQAHWKSGRKDEAAKSYREATAAGFKSPDLHPLEKTDFDRFFVEVGRN
jgi:predicted Zn-dependent protease